MTKPMHPSSSSATVQAAKKRRSLAKRTVFHDRWVNIGGDLEAKKSPTDRYVDIRAKGKPRTRLFLDAGALTKALALARNGTAGRVKEESIRAAGALALNSLRGPAKRRVMMAWIKAFPESAPPRWFRGLAETYGQQLDDLGKTLVRTGHLTKRGIARDGVRNAVLKAFVLKAAPPAPLLKPKRPIGERKKTGRRDG